MDLGLNRKLHELLGICGIFTILACPIPQVFGQAVGPTSEIATVSETISAHVSPQIVSASQLGSASYHVPAPTVVPAPLHTSSLHVSSAGESLALAKSSAFSRELEQIIRRAMDDLNEDALPELASAKNDLQAAIRDLESYVRIESDRGQAWSKFLRLDEIKQELSQDRPSVAKLVAIEMNMRQNYLGLEYAPFLAVRNSLNRVVQALKYGLAPARTIQVLDRRMNELLVNLKESPAESSTKLSSDLARITNYLYESGQSPGAVQEIKRKFNVPNIRVYADERFLNRLVARSVAEPNPVNECLLGTRIIGRACLSGNVSVDLHPMFDGVTLDLNMSAMMTSHNSGYNRGVVLRSTGTSPVFASKRVFVTPTGLSSSPATVATNLTTRIHAIEHRLRLVRRIARKKAAEQKPLADQIAQGRLRNRIQSGYEQQVNDQLAQANGRLKKLNNDRPELKRLDIPQPKLAVFSTSDSVNANVVQAASYQLSASRPCSIQRPVSSGVVVELHQSVAVNTLETLLGGRTIHNHDLDDLAMQFLGEVPEEIQQETHGDPWEVTMAAFNPVQMEFDNNQIKLTLRISHMEGKERSLGSGAIITAIFEPSYADNILTLRRQGELDIEVPNVRSSIQATNFRSILKAKFDPIFEQEIVTERLDIRKWMPNAPQLDLNWFQLKDGWLQIGVR